MRLSSSLSSGLSSLFAAVLVVGCASEPAMKPVTLVPKVDLPRFMGDWYVIANIPTFLEKGAHNAKDSYTLCDPDGTIPDDFQFQRRRRRRPEKKLRLRAAIVMDSGCPMRSGDSSTSGPSRPTTASRTCRTTITQTVITREKRDYVWIMARTPTIPETDLARLIAFVGTQGYDTTKLQRVPQASGK